MNREMRANTRVVWFSLLAVLLIGVNAWSKVIYVDDDVVSLGDGMSWATAYRYLQDALSDARATGEPVEIRVAQGFYKPDLDASNPQGTGEYPWEISFRLEDGMSLLGGYAGVNADDPNARDFEAYETVLSGDLEGNDAEVTDAALLYDDATRYENATDVVSVEGDAVLVEGFAITGAMRSGVRIQEGTLDVMVRDCSFRGNRGDKGNSNVSAGALTSHCEGLIVVRCSFIDNAADKGAIMCWYRSCFEDCLFARNYSWGPAGGGAGVLWDAGGSFSDCVFVNNRAKRRGGALHFSWGGWTLTRCVFRENVAGTYGGALSNLHGSMSLVDCAFVGNKAETTGGACGHLSTTVTAVNCVFVGNQAGSYGGGCVVREEGSLDLVNCTVAGNRAPEAEFLWSDYYLDEAASCVNITNCLLAPEGSEVFSAGSRIVATHTCFGQTVELLSGSNDWLVLGEGNIDADPCFVDPGYWDDNGTADDPNDDFFVVGDYHLKSQAGRWDEVSRSWVADDVTSPCIDAGEPNSPIGHEPFPNGGIVNMGAYGGTAQASKSYFGQPACETVIAGDLNGDCIVDMADLAILVRHWLEVGTLTDE